MITAMKPLPTFLHVCNYLLQEENRQLHTTKMEAAKVTTSKGAPAGVKQPTPQALSHKNSNKSQKRRKHSYGPPTMSANSSQGSTKPAPTAQYNPWTGLVQAWPFLHWHPVTSGLLGTHPPLPHQALLAAAPGLASTPYFDNPAPVSMMPVMNLFFANASTPPAMAMASL
jgi:hypothetical protein